MGGGDHSYLLTLGDQGAGLEPEAVAQALAMQEPEHHRLGIEKEQLQCLTGFTASGPPLHLNQAKEVSLSPLPVGP